MVAPPLAVRARQRELQLQRRRRRRCSAIIEQMKVRGLSLHCSFEQPEGKWRLSDGTYVDAATAQLIIANANVVPVGRALFAGLTAQVYRHTSTSKEK